MAEIRRTFSAGRMNKDIDERLLHPGEYRDALNVGVGHSEASDIGSIENLLGNERIGTGGIEGEIVQGVGRALAEFTLTNATTVGIKRYDLEEKIYWFTAADEGSFIFEYDSIAGTVAVVLADVSGILNFSADNLIIGINILGGQLFWTDGITEPKKIDIARFKAGSTAGQTLAAGVNLPAHTQVYGRAFIESDITVIKKNPLSAPTVTVSETLRPDGGTFNVSTRFDFSSSEVGDSVTLGLSTTGHAYLEGDTIRLTVIHEGETVVVTGSITRVAGLQIDMTINTLGDIDDTGSLLYSVDIVGNDVIFELKFPRFAYRWKYIDGEYSTYSPFSEAAFITGQFSYNSELGHNLAMTNNIRRVVIDSFDTPTDDVVEIDILYKESNANPVYTVETIPVATASIEITNDQIHAILPEIQLLRPYDNVPKTAFGQEVIANRLVYGNYTHNYDVEVTPEFESNLLNREATNQSIKTGRLYQFGVVYQDQYGRQTPVLSNTSATHSVDVSTSDEATQFAVKLNSPAPSWATDYKMYIKETSTEYYNLALDRYYTGEDGFVWCSFPSSEFNKISIDSYLILKKQHAASGAVKDAGARYKVLDIQTEAPDTLTRISEVVGDLQYENVSASIFNWIEEPLGGNQITIEVVPEASYYRHIHAATHLLFTNSAGDRSHEFTIASVTNLLDDQNDVILPGSLRLEFTEVFTEDNLGDFLTNGIFSPDVRVELIDEVQRMLPEFIGRFFVKIERNGTFDTNIIDTSTINTPDDFVPLISDDIYDRVQPGHAGSDATGFFYDFREEVKWRVNRGSKQEEFIREKGVGISVGSNLVDISFAGTEASGYKNPLWSNEVGNHLGRAGTYIRFVDGGEIYKIVSVEQTAGPNLQSSTTRNAGTFGSASNPTDGYFSINRPGSPSTSFKRWSIVLDKPVTAIPTLTEVVNQNTHGVSAAVGTIDILRNLTENPRTSDGGTPYVADPAIFETEPTGDDALDIYYETQETFPISEHGNLQNLKWYNCFSFENGVESDRIRDDFNGVRLDKGARVSATIADPFMEESRPNGFIWSGIFNSITGINNTNQFILAEGIQKELQPMFGSIQRLHARDTNLIAFCEDKVVRILADKDALFNADGSTNVTASNNVLGQTVPFTGEYGISKNPESFATYGSRMYFTDKNRGVILRLSQDGLTEISSKGMSDYFRDLFQVSTGNIRTSYDDYHDTLNVTINNSTVSYHEESGGWTSRKSFVPELGLSLNNRYYTWYNGELWQHNSRAVPRNNFYGVQYNSSIVFIFNDEPGTVKKFLTLNYEGTQPKTLASYDLEDNVVQLNTIDGGWFSPAMITDLDVGDAKAFIKKEGKWFTNIGVLGGPEAMIAVEQAMDEAELTPGAEGSEEAMEAIEEFLEEIEENLDDGTDDSLESIGPVEEVEELEDPDTGETEAQETSITINLV